MNIEDTTREEEAQSRLDLEAIRSKLAGQTGKRYWRSLEEVADTPEFQRFLDDEFPHRATLGQIDRRSMLKFMGASLALAGLSGCRGVLLPQDKVVPYVKQPEELVPGKPLFYASAMTLGGYATGVLVEQHEGRPTRIEGNPLHPASLRAADSQTQAEILNLYDPDRSESVSYLGDISTWTIFDNTMREVLAEARLNRGEGIRILTGATTSPTFGAVMDRFLTQYPAARWHIHEPAGRGNVHEGARLSFGRPIDTVYNFAEADIVVSLDGDFLSPTEFAGSLAYARQFADRRRVHGKTGTMNRLYSFECSPTLTGAMADHCWLVKPSDVGRIAESILSAIAGGVTSGAAFKTISPAHLEALVADLTGARGRCVVVTGKHQPPAVQALVTRINEALGNFGRTVNHIAPVEVNARPSVGTLAELTEDLKAGRVQTVFILDTNPGYSAPFGLGFQDALANAKVKVHAGLIADETAALCDWHLPLSHNLEAWGDARAFDGTATIIQPLIAPLLASRSAIEILARLTDRPMAGYDLVRDTWRRTGLGGADFEREWNRALHDGVVANSRSRPVQVGTAGGGFLYDLPAGSEIEFVFRPDPSIYDGRFANNGWLQELPKPLTKLTWDNAAIIGPALAERLGLRSEDRVRLSAGGAAVEAGVLVQPGQADGAVTIYLGYGRIRGGTVATASLNQNGKHREDFGGGFNAFLLRGSGTEGFVSGRIEKIGGIYELASTQGQGPMNDSKIRTALNDETPEGDPTRDYNLDNRDVVREFTLADFVANIDEWSEKWREKSEEYNKNNMYPDEIFESPGIEQWGMTIDMNTCIGCGACVTACQSENNIPVVGKIQTKRHRNMHWLRIDRYYSGNDLDRPEVSWQPMMCVHCEKAPCEPVCPVAATVHSHDGLNMMVYNRCVGTRYCSNNCPYKVRKFNYLNFSDNQPNFSNVTFSSKKVPGPLNSPKPLGREMLSMVSNPDVTVRGRGVMEKCTYCVQRISNARIEAKKAGRQIAEGDVVTACQQACPTNTIVFGNIADRNSEVAKLRSDPRSYLLLEELLTRPRTSHLAKLRNPNPAIQQGAQA